MDKHTATANRLLEDLRQQHKTGTLQDGAEFDAYNAFNDYLIREGVRFNDRGALLNWFNDEIARVFTK